MNSIPSKSVLCLLAVLSAAGSLPAQEPPPAPPPAGTPMDNSGLPPAPRVLEQAPAPAPVILPDPAADDDDMDPEQIQQLTAIPDDAAFAAKIEELKKAGRLTDQAIYEMRLLRAWQGENIALLKELATPQKMQEVHYDVAASQFFSSDDQVKSFMALMHALIATRDGDEAAIKTNAMEAIWLFPEHASMVGDMITEYQRQKTMANLQVPMDLKLTPSAGGEPVALAELVKGKKALLLSFWASWAAPSVEQLPATIQLSERLLPLGVVTVGINTEGNPAKAEEQRTQHKITFPWVMEPDKEPLVNLLQIDGVPRTALITPEGKVLFNGHPEDARLQDALRQVGAGL